jgi:hypothetical protein
MAETNENVKPLADHNRSKIKVDKLIDILEGGTSATVNVLGVNRIVFCAVNTDFDGVKYDEVAKVYTTIRKDYTVVSKKMLKMAANEFNWEVRQITLPTNWNDPTLATNTRNGRMVEHWETECAALADDCDQEGTVVILNSRTHGIMHRQNFNRLDLA